MKDNQSLKTGKSKKAKIYQKMDTPFANLKECQDGQFIYIREILLR